MNLDELAAKVEESDQKRVAELNEAADKATFFGELLEVPARLLHRLRAEAYDRGRQSMKDEAIAAAEATEPVRHKVTRPLMLGGVDVQLVDDASATKRNMVERLKAIPVRKEGERG